MSPSSLIFVAVVAIWATYLVVHVARHREYVATARTVDRFSSQMRVLERRAATYTPPTTAGRVSSASLSRSRPLLAAPRADVPGEDGVREPSADTTPAIESPAPPAAPAAEPSTPVVPEVQPQHRVRRAVLATSLLVAVVTGVLAAFSLVAWYVPVVALGLVVATLVGLRRAVVADRAAKRRRAAAARRAQVNAERLAREAAREARPSAPALPVALEYVEPAPESEARPAGQLADDAHTSTLAVPATQVIPAVAENIDPLHGDPAWDPTPVPPPTYTLKARAERPLPPPLDVPVPIEVESDDVYWSDDLGRPHAVNG